MKEETKTHVAFADWLAKYAEPRFPNKSEWYLVANFDKSINAIKTTEELFKIFKKQST